MRHIQPIKILFFTNYTLLYGANRSLLGLVDFLTNKGIECSVICPNYGDLNSELEKRGVKSVVHTYHPNCITKSIKMTLAGILFTLIDFINRRKLLKLVERINPDIIYTNTSVLYHGFFLAKRLKKKHVWHLREFGKEDYNCFHPLGIRFFKKLLFDSDAVVCISKAIYNYYGQEKNSKAKIIYNGIAKDDLPIFPKTLAKNESVGRIKLLIVGNITKAKGQYKAIIALEQVLKIDNKFELIILGDGDPKYVNSLMTYCENSLLLNGHVFFEGFQKDTTQYYQTSHYLLMFSRQEAFGRVTVEAMSYGLPVIGYKSGGTVEVIEDGFNGFLFSDFHLALVDLYKKIIDGNYYRVLSGNAINTSATKFTEERSFSQVYDFLMKICSDFD